MPPAGVIVTIGAVRPIVVRGWVVWKGGVRWDSRGVGVIVRGVVGIAIFVPGLLVGSGGAMGGCTLRGSGVGGHGGRVSRWGGWSSLRPHV